MKVKFYLSIGYFDAIQEDIFDVGDLGFTPPEWENLTEEQKNGHVNEWANNYIDSYYEEVQD